MSQLYQIRIFLESPGRFINDFTISLRPDGSIIKSSKHKQSLGPYYRIKSTDSIVKSNDRCSVCLEHYKVGTYKRTINCNHTFHKKCIDKWFKNTDNYSCPICRKHHNYLLSDLKIITQ